MLAIIMTCYSDINKESQHIHGCYQFIVSQLQIHLSIHDFEMDQFLSAFLSVLSTLLSLLSRRHCGDIQQSSSWLRPVSCGMQRHLSVCGFFNKSQILLTHNGNILLFLVSGLSVSRCFPGWTLCALDSCFLYKFKSQSSAQGPSLPFFRQACILRDSQGLPGALHSLCRALHCILMALSLFVIH